MLGVNAVNGSVEKFTEADWPLFIGMIKCYVILILLSPFMAMSNIYFSFALGNLFNKSKLAMSVLMYFIVQFAETIIGAFCSVFVTPGFIAEASKYQDDLPMPLVFDYFNKIMTVTLIVSVILSIGFAVASERIFAKKLNLE